MHKGLVAFYGMRLKAHSFEGCAQEVSQLPPPQKASGLPSCVYVLNSISLNDNLTK